MPNAPHEIMVELLKEQPELLNQVSQRLQGPSFPAGMKVVDSTTRFVGTSEVTPDLALEDEEGWTAVEVQGKEDPDKGRRLLVLAALKLDQTKKMGDVVVLAFSAGVAEWARHVAEYRSPRGTVLKLEPVVLLLDESAAEKLLDESAPQLAFFAAWAMQQRHGPAAQAIVHRALVLSERLPEPLQLPMKRAILNVLSEKMLAFLKEAAMNPDQIPEGPAMRLFRQEAFADGKIEGVAQGVAQGVVLVLGHLFGRRLGRALTENELDVVRSRLQTLGEERLDDLALTLDGPALAAWLADPTAR